MIKYYQRCKNKIQTTLLRFLKSYTFILYVAKKLSFIKYDSYDRTNQQVCSCQWYTN